MLQTENPQNINKVSTQVWWRDKDKRETALIFATILLALFTAWMALETHKLAADSPELAGAAARSANAAAQSIELTRRNFGIENNPYIGIDSIEARFVPPPSRTNRIITPTSLKDIRIKVYYKNSGRTPAINVRMTHGERIGDVILDSTFVVKLPMSALTASYAAGQTWTTEHSTPGWMERIKAQDIQDTDRWITFGVIKYETVWGDTLTSAYCYQFLPERDLLVPYRKENNYIGRNKDEFKWLIVP